MRRETRDALAFGIAALLVFLTVIIVGLRLLT